MYISLRHDAHDSMSWDDFYTAFQRELRIASHNKLKLLSKELRGALKERFRSGRAWKCEMVERGFSPSELQRFLGKVEDPEDEAAFLLMATLGLRVGELLSIRAEDLTGRFLRIRGSKGGYSATLPVPGPLWRLLPKRKAGSRMFPLRHQELRRRFGKYRELAGLAEIYAIGEPGGWECKQERPLYRITLHSLRHHAIQNFARASRDPDLTRRFARHRHQETTERYLRRDRRGEVERVIRIISQVEKVEKVEKVT